MNAEPTLADLINDRKGDRSYAQLAKDAGRTPHRNRWQQLATIREQNKFPDPDTLRGVAKALNVPMSEVVKAAARTVGLPVRTEDPSAFTISGAGILSPKQRNWLLDMARKLAKANAGVDL